MGRQWRRLPKGLKYIVLIALLAVVVIVAVNVAGRFVDSVLSDETDNASAVSNHSSSNDTVVNSTSPGYGHGEGTVPVSSVREFRSKLELTRGQVRQLLASCTCTG